MKKLILTSATVLFISLSAFAQNTAYNEQWYESENTAAKGLPRELSYGVRGNYERPVTKEKLDVAKSISDFIPDYPVNWITEYVSVEILAACNGKVMKAVSANDVLSAEQKNILKTVDPGTAIIINVKYRSKNTVTDNIENHTMNVSMMIVPEREAEYVGGKQQMKKYLKENVINKIYETIPGQFQDANAIVIFTVNEEGEIVNAKISKTSGDPKTDKLLVEAITKMPKWKPAENSKGIKVKQEFEFSVGNGGC